MTCYKLSVYNNIFQRNSAYYLWNTFSGAFIKLDATALEYISNFSGEADDSEYFRILLQNGCVVKREYDELGKLLYDEKAITMEMNPKRIFFTIAPGLGCNYKCEYCFENERTSFRKMSPETQEALFKYVCARIDANKNLQRISITWFGGEPLLYMDIIYPFSKRIIRYCEEHGVEYYSGMISNGRYLTPKNVALLEECRIGHLQISMDGMEKTYCKVKGATPEDFAAVIDNIVYAAPRLPLAIRINVRGGAIEEANRLTEYLLSEKHLDGKIKVYIAHVREYELLPNNVLDQAGHKRFLESEKEYYSMFGKTGKYLLRSLEYRIPRRRGTTCISVCNANSCIGPDGEMYECEHHFGIKGLEVGSIFDGCYYNDSYCRFLNFPHYPRCMECSFFPVCMGGCMDDKVNNRDMISCKEYQERLIDIKFLELSHD